MLAYIGLAVCAAVFSFFLLMIVRNRWVYRVRMAILYADFAAYQSLPDYDVMMWRLWVWDAAKFLDWPETQEMKEARDRERKAQLGRRILGKGQNA